MRQIINNIIRSRFILTLLILALTNMFALAQAEEEVYEPSLEIKCVKQNDDSRLFKAALIGEGTESFPIYEAELVFYNLAGEEKIEIGKAKTDKDGKVSILVKPDFKYLKDEEGKINISAEFAGSDVLSPTEASIAFFDLKLSMKLKTEDSTNLIVVNAYSIDAQGNEVPLNEITFNFYIDGLFSRLPVGEGFLENGECVFEFPKDLRGDHEGNLNIYAAFVDNDDFGNVEKMESAKWGTHRTNYQEPTRELWTTGAPRWMIITLTILLVGVWSHYAYAVIQLILIRKEGKN